MVKMFLCREEEKSALVGGIVEWIGRLDEVALDGVDLCDLVCVDGFIERFLSAARRKSENAGRPLRMIGCIAGKVVKTAKLACGPSRNNAENL